MLCEYAKYGGNLSVLEYLLMHDDNNMHPVLRLLKQRCEPGGIGLSVFVSAAAGGHLKCLEFLLSDLNRIVRYSKKVKYYSAIFLQYLLIVIKYLTTLYIMMVNILTIFIVCKYLTNQ